MWRYRVRLLLKLALLVGCITGFTYQATHFLILYYKYPVDTSISIKYMNSLDLPAISLCNFNSYRRTKFCKMFPDKCEEWKRNDTVCKTWPYYCFTSSEPLLVPKVAASELLTYNRSVHFQLAHSYHGLVKNCDLTVNVNDSRPCDKPLAFQCVNDWFNPTTCYTINFFWLKKEKQELEIPNTAGLEMDLYPEQHEFFPDSWYPGFQVAVHPGKTVVNPFAKGYTFLSGRAYYVDIKMDESHLLKSPYRTHCQHYVLGWNPKDGAEPADKQSCEKKCHLRRSLEKYGCAIFTLQYPHNEIMCTSERELPPEVIKECAMQCPSPCYTRDYEMDVDEYPQYQESPPCRLGTKSKEWCSRTKLFFTFSQFYTMSYTLKPKYTNIEIFSNIGGYLGMWLGVSLLSLSDIVWPLLRYVKERVSHRKKCLVFATKTAPVNTSNTKNSHGNQSLASESSSVQLNEQLR